MPSADGDATAVATSARPTDPGVRAGGPRTAPPSATGLIVPRWVPVAGLPTVAAGLAVATYLTIAHFDTASLLACPGTRIINCEKVTTSPESQILGIPVAILGLVFFAVMAVAMLPATWRTAHPAVRFGRLLFALTGIGMVVYLVYTELFTLDAVCLWCSAVHGLTLILFAIIVAGTVLAVPAGDPGVIDVDDDDLADELDEPPGPGATVGDGTDAAGGATR